MKKLILTLAFSLTTLFGADFSVQEYKKTFEQFSNEELIKMISAAGELPSRIDHMTTLDKAEPKDSDLISYYYTINNTNDVKLETFNKKQKKIFLDIMKKQITTRLCGNNVTMAILDRGIKFGYFYKLENSQNFAKFILSKADCK